MPRFVILRHDAPRGTHYDFMLEAGDSLRTWSLPQPPENGVTMECASLADHRMAYLDYEGEVSGGRGIVTQWDRGGYTAVRQDAAEWIVALSGEKTVGLAALHRIADSTDRWQFRFNQTQ